MANECIPIYRPGADVTCLTTAAVTGKTFVNVSGPLVVGNPAAGTDATLIRVATAAAGARAFGVAVYDAASGARVPVITQGGGHVVPVTCGAAITAGAEVECNASGKAITLATGKALGKAVSTTTAADTDVFVQLY